MGKVAIRVLVMVMVGSCSYQVERLLPPPADASSAPSQSHVVPADASVDARSAVAPEAGADGTHGAAAPEVAADALAGRDAGAGEVRPGDAYRIADLGKTDAEDGGGDGSQTVVASFSGGRAQGALSGYGSISLGAADSVSTPTCAGMPIGGLAPSMPPVTFASTCRPSDITWNAAAGLCVTGYIPGWSSNRSYGDNLLDWGIMVATAARDPMQALGVTYKTIALSVTGSDSGYLLAVVHLAGDDSNRTYCAWMASGATLKLSTFNTECYFGSGQSLAASDVQKIDRIGVLVPAAENGVTLSDFCLTRIALGK